MIENTSSYLHHTREKHHVTLFVSVSILKITRYRTRAVEIAKQASRVHRRYLLMRFKSGYHKMIWDMLSLPRHGFDITEQTDMQVISGTCRLCLPKRHRQQATNTE